MRPTTALLAAGLPLLLLAGCQPPPFPNQARPVGAAPAACPDWRTARLSHPMDALLSNVNPAESLALGCVNDTNLRRMVADPADLEGGKGTGPAPASSAAGAVQRYDRDEVKALPQTHSFGGS